MTILIKLTLGNIFVKVKKSARAAPLSQNSWYIFQMQITPLLRRPQGPQGCLEKRNCPLSSNLAVWCAKIGPKTQKLQKTIKKPPFSVVFVVIYEVFWTFKLLGPILAHQTTKFELSGQFRFSRHPWGPWGRQSSGVIWNETKISWFGHCVLYLEWIDSIKGYGLTQDVINGPHCKLWNFCNWIQRCTRKRNQSCSVCHTRYIL